MDISVYEVMKSGGMTAGSTCYFDFDRSSGCYSGIMFEKGFFFLLCHKRNSKAFRYLWQL